MGGGAAGAAAEGRRDIGATGELGDGWEQADLVRHFVKRCKMQNK